MARSKILVAAGPDLFRLYNQAFAHNWEYYPLSEKEITFMVNDLKPVAIPGMMQIMGPLDHPVGLLLACRILSAAFRASHGRLTPWSIARLLWAKQRPRRAALVAIAVAEAQRRQGECPLNLRIRPNFEGNGHPGGRVDQHRRDRRNHGPGSGRPGHPTGQDTPGLRERDLAVPLTLVHAVQSLAHAHGNKTAFIFLGDGETESGRLTYAQLESQAGSIATQLQTDDLLGQPVLLAYPPGLDFVAGLLGCWMAGAIAVPCYPPQLDRNRDRLAGILAATEPRVVLTTGGVKRQLERWADPIPRLKTIPYLVTDDLPAVQSGRFRPIRPEPGP